MSVNAYITTRTDNGPFESYVFVIDLATNQWITSIYIGYQANIVAINSDGSRIYVSGTVVVEGVGLQDAVVVIDTSDYSIVATVDISAYGAGSYGIAVSPDDSYVYVTHEVFDNITVIETATNTITDDFEVGVHPLYVTFNPDGDHAYVILPDTFVDYNQLAVVDTATQTVTTLVAIGVYSTNIVAHPSGNYIYTAGNGEDGSYLYVIETATNTISDTIALGTVSNPYTGPTGVALSPNGTRAYIANFEEGTTVVDISTGTVIGTIGEASGSGIAMTVDGLRAYTINSPNEIVMIDPVTNSYIGEMLLDVRPDNIFNSIVLTPLPTPFPPTLFSSLADAICGDEMLSAGIGAIMIPGAVRLGSVASGQDQDCMGASYCPAGKPPSFCEIFSGSPCGS